MRDFSPTRPRPGEKPRWRTPDSRAPAPSTQQLFPVYAQRGRQTFLHPADNAVAVRGKESVICYRGLPTG